MPASRRSTRAASAEKKRAEKKEPEEDDEQADETPKVERAKRSKRSSSSLTSSKKGEEKVSENESMEVERETTTQETKNGGGSASTVPGEGWSNGAVAPQMFPVTQEGRVQLYSSQRRWIGLHAGWTRIGSGHEHDKRHSASRKGKSQFVTVNGEKIDPVAEATAVRALIAQLCENFYRHGWATGTGGGVSIRVGGDSDHHESEAEHKLDRPWRVFVAPSGIQKEDMIGDDIFELDMDRNVIVPPKTPGLRQSACTPLWYVVYRNRPTSTCVIHTHSMHAQMATLLDPTEQSDTLRITHLEMLKGVGNHAYDDVLEIPIIDNRPTEDALAAQLEVAIQKYPKCNAVLVRRHGIYVWGDTWEQAKTQCESFDYLFQTAIQMKQMLHLDPGVPPAHGTYRVDDVSKENDIKTETKSSDLNMEKQKSPPDESDKSDEPATKKAKTTPTATVKEEKNGSGDGFHGNQAVDNAADLQLARIPLFPRDADKVKILLLDIEGCTTSISFVKDELFPYVRKNLKQHLDKNLTDEECHKLSLGLDQEIKDHPKDSDESTPAAAVAEDKGESLRACIEKQVYWLMDRDVKSATLKDLQGNMWQAGYEAGDIKGHVYADFKWMCEWIQKHNTNNNDKKVQICIYSSGSIQAQKLLFGNSVDGDLLPFLSNHFDITTAGNKKESASYQKIAEALKVEPSHICFVSDLEAELAAARQAGVGHTVMSIRPGNAPLTEEGKEHYPAIYSLLQLCGE